jgi:hypothetical protein
MKISSFAPSVVTASAPRTTASSAPSPASQARSGVLTVGNTVSEPAEFLRRCINVFGNMDEAIKAIVNVLGKTAKTGLKNEKKRSARRNSLTPAEIKKIYLRILTTYAGDQRFQLQLSPKENTLVRRPLGENPSKRRR